MCRNQTTMLTCLSRVDNHIHVASERAPTVVRDDFSTMIRTIGQRRTSKKGITIFFCLFISAMLTSMTSPVPTQA